MQQLPQERLIVAVGGIGAMERALTETVAYTKERKAFGKTIWSFQNTRFKLAEVQATVIATRAYVDACMTASTEPRSQNIVYRNSNAALLTNACNCMAAMAT